MNPMINFSGPVVNGTIQGSVSVVQNHINNTNSGPKTIGCIAITEAPLSADLRIPENPEALQHIPNLQLPDRPIVNGIGSLIIENISGNVMINVFQYNAQDALPANCKAGCINIKYKKMPTGGASADMFQQFEL